MKKTDSAKLDQIISTLGEMNASMERSFAAVADDIADLPTKNGVRVIIDEKLKPISDELVSIRRDLDALSQKVENMIGYRKEIDHALERIAAIEKHLGIEKLAA